MIRFGKYFCSAALLMMLAACSVNDDSSGDDPVPPERYETTGTAGGMETSNFAVTYPSMQIFTFGPNVYDAHTINEHVEISSIEHAWKYMLELLKNIK